MTKTRSTRFATFANIVMAAVIPLAAAVATLGHVAVA